MGAKKDAAVLADCPASGRAAEMRNIANRSLSDGTRGAIAGETPCVQQFGRHSLAIACPATGQSAPMLSIAIGQPGTQAAD